MASAGATTFRATVTSGWLRAAQATRPMLTPRLATVGKVASVAATGAGVAATTLEAMEVHDGWNTKYRTTGQKAAAVATLGVNAAANFSGATGAVVRGAALASGGVALNVVAAIGSEDYDYRGMRSDALAGELRGVAVAGLSTFARTRLLGDVLAVANTSHAALNSDTICRIVKDFAYLEAKVDEGFEVELEVDDGGEGTSSA